jgi:hypothetical protein
MSLKPWPIVVDELYGDVPIGWFPADDANHKLVLMPFGGLSQLCKFPLCSEIREGWTWGDYMYWAAKRGSDTVIFRTDETGVYTEVGSFATSASGPLWMRNNQTQLGISDGVSGYTFTPSTNTFAQITDVDFPGAGCLEYQDGYGIFFDPGTNLWYITAMNDFRSVDALDFYSKEAKTDIIRTIRSFQRELYIFGVDKGTELWYNAGGDNSSAQNPTFARNAGGLIEYGSGAAKGESDMGGTAITFLSSQGQLIQAKGTSAAVVSSQKFDREVAGDGTLAYPGYTTFEDAVAFSYTDQGHIFHQVTFPTADVTWILDGTTKLLLKRRSYKAAGGYGRHRANCYTLFKKKHYVGDFENGTIYEMSASNLDDNGNLIQRVLYSKDINNGRDRVSFPPIQVALDSGHGLASGETPYVGLEFSRDGGKTWSNMVTRSAGKAGEYTRQANFYQMGSDCRRMYRLTMTERFFNRIVGLDFGFENA